MKRFLWIYGITWMIFLFFLSREVPAFYGDIATDRASFTLGVAGQNQNQITSLTTVQPIQQVNGWGGLYLSRQVAENTVIAETLNAHLQGGGKLGPIGVEGMLQRRGTLRVR